MLCRTGKSQNTQGQMYHWSVCAGFGVQGLNGSLLRSLFPGSPWCIKHAVLDWLSTFTVEFRVSTGNAPHFQLVHGRDAKGS